MKGIRSLTMLALAAFASAQTIDSLDPCGQQCYNESLNKAGQFSCGAMDMNCLCRVADFNFSIRDCAERLCPSGYAPTVIAAAAAVCATATLPPGAPVPTEPTAGATPTPTVTEAPPSSSSTSSEGSSTSSTTFESSTTPTATGTSSSSTTTSTGSTTAKPTKAATGTTTSATSAESTSEAPAGAAESGGLSEAAKIGIGIGVGAALIALAALAACMFLRKRRSAQGPAPKVDRFKISHPMPSDEHAYTHNNTSEYDIGSGDLEMKSRRYEDTMQGQEPRQMV